jgi:predicted polyphosphate/ATP-dependent NAD kinase
MSIVGIIPNPASGKDIRRLVALGSVFGNQEKVNIIRRVLVGLDHTGVERIYIMPDVFGIGWQAVDGLGHANKHIAAKTTILEMHTDNDAADSMRAAAMMADLGATAIVTLGGDGTNRVVAKGCRDVPLVALSTGTNNVVPYMIEGTIAGLAAGFVSQHPEDIGEMAFRSKRLEIYKNGAYVDLALVDVAVVAGTSVGARAVWDPDVLRQVIVTRGAPDSTGMSALVGFFHPISPREPVGLSLQIDPESANKVTAPLAPGVIVTVGLGPMATLAIGDSVTVHSGPHILALDGEREVPLGPKDYAEVRLTADGPWLVDVRKAMQFAVKSGAFQHDGGADFPNL